MSEVEDKWEIERITPVVELDLGDREVELTYGNTTIYTFMGGWAMANHVYIKRADGPGGTYLFDCQEFMDQLHEQHFPATSQPYPTDGDVLAFRNWTNKRLERELEDL